MTIIHHLVDLIEDADGASVLTLGPLCPQYTAKQIGNALQQARLGGLIHAAGYAHIPGTRCAKVAIYKPGPDPKATPKAAAPRPVASVWELGAAA